MANTKSSKKRVIINQLRNKINTSKKSKLKTYIKKTKLAVKNKDQKLAIQYYCITQSLLDKYASKNIIHINKSSRYKALLSKLINNL